MQTKRNAFSRLSTLPILTLLYCLVLAPRTFSAQNHAPTASNDTFSVNEDNVLTVAAPGVLQNDNDPDQDALTAIKLSSPAHGTLTFNANGGFTFTPQANFHGLDSFAYKCRDSEGADSGIATVTIGVDPVNDKPVAVGDSYTINEDQPLSRTAAGGVLANDTDIDGDTLSVSTSVTSVFLNPEHGTLSMNSFGSFFYVPNPNFNGTDSFLYRINDGHTGGFDIGGVNITIQSVNDAPIVANRSIDVAANGVSGLVRLNGTDVDGDTLTFQTCCGPFHGTLSGTLPFFRYTPTAGFVGDDHFVYRANDGQVNSASAEVIIHVKPTLTISDESIVEGNIPGGIFSTPAFFRIQLSPAVSFPVNVRFRTDNITATPGVDYQLRDEITTIAAGGTSYDDAVLIYGDLDVEPDETFRIRLESAEAIVLRSSLVTIVNDDQSIGVTEGVPPDVIARVGERIDYAVLWTHPERWRLLDTIDVRISDEEGETLTVHFDEADNAFSLFDSDTEKLLRPSAPGERVRFETTAAVMYLENSEVIGSGPTGPSVLLKLNLSFKPQAAGRLLQVEAFATDDSGSRQGFDPVGTITVLSR